jgi:tetratricopeptide (TPR) repeat protein
MRTVAASLVLLAVVCFSGCSDRVRRPDAELSPAEVQAGAMELLNDGKQGEAEDFLQTYLAIYPHDQRIAFLYACCRRSRFSIAESTALFQAVVRLGSRSPEGQCAHHIIELDGHRDVGRHFDGLRSLASAHPKDPMIRWMMAVQCRNYDANDEGVFHYKKLFEIWNPGPVLVHQTYGNLLHALKRYDEALVERRKAVELEPAGWSYDGLGLTLTKLERYEEADEAFEYAVEINPDQASYWNNWAVELNAAGEFAEAIKRCQKAIEVDPTHYRAWSNWGLALELQGKLEDALEKYKKALAIDPSNQYARNRLRAVEIKLQANRSAAESNRNPLMR